MRDLTMSFQMVKYNLGDKIIKYGEFGDRFYVLIKGSVSVHIPNPLIRHWQEKVKYKQDLIDWKHGFDVKLKAKITMQFLKTINDKTEASEKKNQLQNLEKLYS